MSNKKFIIKNTNKEVESERISKLYDKSKITKFEMKYILNFGLCFGLCGSVVGLEGVLGGILLGLSFGDLLARHDIKKRYEPVKK